MTLESGGQVCQSSFGKRNGDDSNGETTVRVDDPMVKDVQEVTRLAALLAEAIGRMGSLVENVQECLDEAATLAEAETPFSDEIISSM